MGPFDLSLSLSFRAAGMKVLLVLGAFVGALGSTIPDNPAPQFVEGWPEGMYGLPRTTSESYEGCPGGGWYTGSRRQDGEGDGISDFSSPNHLFGYHGTADVEQGFCLKGNPEGAEWPHGNYCVYKYDGEDCPSGFTTGSITWDDEDYDNVDENHGMLPDGSFPIGDYSDTTYNYCCRNDGSPDHEITLPTTRPFYLFPHSNACQKVSGMTSSEEWILFDTENDNNGAGNSASGDHPRAV